MSTPPELLADLLRRRAREQRVLDQARATGLRHQLREAIRLLCQEGAVEAAWLIGSLAWGDFGERSDVNVVVRGAAPAEIGTLANRLADTLAVSVDLLRLEDLSEAFGNRVLVDGVRMDEP